MDLYEHNMWLRGQTRWDWAGPFLGGGSLALGAGIGGLVANAGWTAAVIACIAAGAVSVVCGVVLKDQRSKEVRQGYEEFDRRLCLYDENPRAQAVRALLDARAEAQAQEHTVRAKLRRLKGRI